MFERSEPYLLRSVHSKHIRHLHKVEESGIQCNLRLLLPINSFFLHFVVASNFLSFHSPAVLHHVLHFFLCFYFFSLQLSCSLTCHFAWFTRPASIFGLSIIHADMHTCRVRYMSMFSPSCCSPPTHSPPDSVSRLSHSHFYYRLSISAFISLCVYERGYIESVWLVDTEKKRGRECMMRQ